MDYQTSPCFTDCIIKSNLVHFLNLLFSDISNIQAAWKNPDWCAVSKNIALHKSFAIISDIDILLRLFWHCLLPKAQATWKRSFSERSDAKTRFILTKSKSLLTKSIKGLRSKQTAVSASRKAKLKQGLFHEYHFELWSHRSVFQGVFVWSLNLVRRGD